MNLPFHQVDAFVVDGKPLTGNPAAVMPLDDWLDDAMLQAIAVENNLSETAFLKRSNGDADWDLRWFTPGREVDLCGHATLASAHVVMGDADRVTFATRSGILAADRQGDEIVIDLPGATDFADLTDPRLSRALGVDAEELFIAYAAEDAIVAVLRDEAAVRAVRPDFGTLAGYEYLVIVTAPGDEADIASRVFAPFYGIDEDPVTGAAHAAIAPWWARRLEERRFGAMQTSARGGFLSCQVTEDRVLLGGRCATIINGEFGI